jgi:hypothetical protein
MSLYRLATKRFVKCGTSGRYFTSITTFACRVMTREIFTMKYESLRDVWVLSCKFEAEEGKSDFSLRQLLLCGVP